jgi:hypothetical protein
MALQYSVAVRNARLDVVESTITPSGSSPLPSAFLELRSGPPPATCAAADTGTLLAQIVLPTDWMAAASAGVKAKTGATWSGTGITSGNIAHFRIKDGGSPDTCHIQGNAGLSGSPDYDMVVDNVAVTGGQVITVSSFSLTAGNA